MNERRIIDDLDVSLAIPERTREVLAEAIERFQSEHAHVEVQPRLQGNRLLVNSTDLIALLGYIDPTHLSELEHRALLRDVKRAIDRLLLSSTSLAKQSHYKWCLAATTSLPLGRHLSS